MHTEEQLISLKQKLIKKIDNIEKHYYNEMHKKCEPALKVLIEINQQLIENSFKDFEDL